MTPEQARGIIERAGAAGAPRIELIKRAQSPGARIGIFAASFNPPTNAHVELMRRARETFSLGETLALAGLANADKPRYESSLEDRLLMLALALAGNPRVSIGLSSHAFYVDMLDALEEVYSAETDLHFIIGFDTFERVVDREDKYTARYHRRFTDREAALKCLLARASLIVAGRAGAGRDEFRALVESDPVLSFERVHYLDFPEELAERSATEVRNLARASRPIAGLVPPGVEQYIRERGLYRQPC
jgi:nicotinate (nicotinamide) nucleotide adenylyltransferase